MVTRTIIQNFDNKADQRLHEDLLNEFVQTWGIDVWYLPRTSMSNSGFDLLFGDDPTKSYTGPQYVMEMYIQSVDSFEGGEFFTKFSMAVKKQARFLLPNRAFNREVQGAFNRPREGDLLWLPNFQALFEIKFVNEEHFFYDFGKGAKRNTKVDGKPTTDFYGFSLITEKFRYNGEVITTGNQEITDAVNSLTYAYEFAFSTANGAFDLGETVYQTANNNIHGTKTATANVISFSQVSNTAIFKDIQGLFLANTNVFGANATWTYTSSNLYDSVNHLLSDNQDILQGANNVLSWTEGNPFGET